MSWSKEPQVNHNSDNCNFLNCIMIHESVLLPIVNDTPQWWNTGRLLDLNVAQSMLLRGNIIHFKWWFISVWSGSCYVLMRCSLTWASFDLRIMKSRLNWADDVSRQPIRGKKRMSCKFSLHMLNVKQITCCMTFNFSAFDEPLSASARLCCEAASGGFLHQQCATKNRRESTTTFVLIASLTWALKSRRRVKRSDPKTSNNANREPILSLYPHCYTCIIPTGVSVIELHYKKRLKNK